MVGAIAIGLFGLFQEDSWLLLMIAVFGYATCWQNRRMLRELDHAATGEFGPDFTRGYSFLNGEEDGETRKPGFFERRRARATARKTLRERQARDQRESAVEQILQKVSATGLESLSANERRILAEETRRQQSLEGESRGAHRS